MTTPYDPRAPVGGNGYVDPQSGQVDPYNAAVTKAQTDQADATAQANTPKPDAGPGWVWQRNTQSWAIDPGQQSAHDQWAQQQTLAATGTNYAQNAPTLQGAQAQGFGTTNIADARTDNRDPNVVAGRAAPSIDTTQTDQARIARDQALADQRRVLEQTLSLKVDPLEQQALQQRYQERGLATANTLAANARGGAGAVAAARGMAIQQTPQIAGQAAEQARQEELQAFNQRIQQASTAGGIASTIGQTATGAFGQEAGLANDAAQVGLGVIDRITAETGMKISADLQQQQQLGGMIQDINHLGFNYAGLDVGVQQDIFDQIAASHHIDQQAAAQIKAIAEQKKKGVMDYIMGAFGAVEGAAGVAGGLGWKPLAAAKAATAAEP